MCVLHVRISVPIVHLFHVRSLPSVFPFSDVTILRSRIRGRVVVPIVSGESVVAVRGQILEIAHVS